MHAKFNPTGLLPPVEARDLTPRRIGVIVSFDDLDGGGRATGKFHQLSAVGDGSDEVVLNVSRSGYLIPEGVYRDRVGDDDWMTEHVLGDDSIITFEPAGTVA